MGSRLLGIYLNDHLAGAIAGRELARRCLRNNRSSELGSFLEGFLQEVDEDIASLEQEMAALGVSRAAGKAAAGWALEKLGRLKLNGRLLGYSPLSRVEELEGLCLGVGGKESLWRALLSLADREEAIDRGRVEELLTRAQNQRLALERHRLAAARLAFG